MPCSSASERRQRCQIFRDWDWDWPPCWKALCRPSCASVPALRSMGAAAAGAAHSCDGIPRASSHTIMTSGASGPALNRKLKMGRSQAPIRAGFNGERPSSSPRAQRKVSGCTGPRGSPRGPDLWNFEGSRWRVHNKRGFLQLRILCTVPPVYVHTAKYSTRRALRQNKQGCTGAHKSSAPPPPLT